MKLTETDRGTGKSEVIESERDVRDAIRRLAKHHNTTMTRIESQLQSGGKLLTTGFIYEISR